MSNTVKARVIVAFTDKTNMRDVYQPGDMFEGVKERVEELKAGGFVTVDKPKTNKG